MKLIDYENNREFALETSRINLIAIESHRFFDKFVHMLYDCFERNEQYFKLENEAKFFELIKSADFIYSPFSICFEKRELQKKLFSILKEEAFENGLIEKFNEYNSELINFFEDLQDCFGYQLDYECDIGLDSIFKAYGLCLQETSGSFLERFVEYMEIMHRLCGKKLFVLISCVDYLNDKDIELLIKQSEYEGVMLLFIENRQRGLKDLINEYIIDEDLCELY